jgi:hypothetical protein
VSNKSKANKFGPGLTGFWFHSLKDGKVNWQGQVVHQVSDGVYVAQLFEWLAGGKSNCVIVRQCDMEGWMFYQSGDDMCFSLDYGPASRLSDFGKKGATK